jgi:hypothetical protein
MARCGDNGRGRRWPGRASVDAMAIPIDVRVWF